MSHDVFLRWAQIHKASKHLSEKLSDKNWYGIVAVTRGGMIPACLVARELNIALIETFCIATYSFKDQNKADIAKPLSLMEGGRDWLVIDDLVDSGQTFEIIRGMIPNAHYACLYAKPQGEKQADTFVESFPQDNWVHFPWEVDADTGNPQGK